MRSESCMATTWGWGGPAGSSRLAGAGPVKATLVGAPVPNAVRTSVTTETHTTTIRAAILRARRAFVRISSRLRFRARTLSPVAWGVAIRARTQGARVSWKTWATEDAAGRRFAAGRGAVGVAGWGTGLAAWSPLSLTVPGGADGERDASFRAGSRTPVRAARRACSDEPRRARRRDACPHRAERGGQVDASLHSGGSARAGRGRGRGG